MVIPKLLIVSCVLILIGCATPLVPTNTPVARTYPIIISIGKEWSGYADTSPEKTYVTLQRSGNEFIGAVFYSVGGHFGDSISTTENITVPLDAINSFAQILTSAPLESGSYNPPPTHTDDYPSINILIKMEDRTMSFYSTSQAEGYNPWQVMIYHEYAGTPLISRSDIPKQAMDLLDPYVKLEIRERLIQQIRNRRIQQKTSTPQSR